MLLLLTTVLYAAPKFLNVVFIFIQLAITVLSLSSEHAEVPAESIECAVKAESDDSIEPDVLMVQAKNVL